MKLFYRPWMPFLLLFLAIALPATSQKAGHRSNIPPPERLKVAQEAQAGEIRAEREAQKKYGDPKQVAQKRRMQQTLEERYYFQICWRHKITHQQLVRIMSENLKSNPGGKP